MKSREPFYVAQDYEELVLEAVPFYQDFHGALGRVLAMQAGGPSDCRVLDLGVGWGATARAVLDAVTPSEVTGVDWNIGMLANCRRRLATYGKRVRLLAADFEGIELAGSGFDACTSAFAIHHLPDMRKRRMWRRISSALAPGGLFLLLDWLRFSEESMERMSREEALRFLRFREVHVDLERAWLKHWDEENDPSTLMQVTTGLENAGFERPECICRWFGVGLVVARKALDR